MSEPQTIPLSSLQQRDVRQLLAQYNQIQDKLNLIARTVIAGADIDPETLGNWSIDIRRPDVGVILQPPADLHIVNG